MFNRKGRVYFFMKRKFKEHVIFKGDGFSEEIADAICATECTGLIPSHPENEEELESYRKILNYSAKNIVKNKTDSKS